MLCANCGNENDERAIFCVRCANDFIKSKSGGADTRANFTEKYEIIREINRSEFSVLYRVRDLESGEESALKAIATPTTLDRSVIESVVEEQQSYTLLDHPNIVKIYDTGYHADNIFIVMHSIDGESLDYRMRRIGDFSLTQAIDIAGQMGSAIDYAHRQGLVHGDLKPSNIFITSTGKILISDFGFSKAAARAIPSAFYSTTMTLDYKSPEDIGGDAVTPASDIYSMGVILYEMITGRAPFMGIGLEDIWDKKLKNHPVSVKDRKPYLPDSLDKVFSSAMAADPKDRPKSAAALAEMLKRETGRADSNTGLFSTFLMPSGIEIKSSKYFDEMLSIGHGPIEPISEPSAPAVEKLFKPDTQPISPVEEIIPPPERHKPQEAMPVHRPQPPHKTEHTAHPQPPKTLPPPVTKPEPPKSKTEPASRTSPPPPPPPKTSDFFAPTSRPQTVVPPPKPPEKTQTSKPQQQPAKQKKAAEFTQAVDRTRELIAQRAAQAKPKKKGGCIKAFVVIVAFWILVPKIYHMITGEKNKNVISSAATVSVSFESTPIGASVKVDNVETCETPCSLSLTVGTHNVVIGKTGYKNYDRILVFEEGDEQKISAPLEVEGTEGLAKQYYDQAGNEKDIAARIELYKKSIKLNPNSAPAHNDLAVDYMEQEKYKEALFELKKALQANPNYSYAFNNIGVIYLRQERLDEALSAFKSAVSNDSNYANAYDNLGKVYFKQKKYDLALDAYKNAFDKDPKNPNYTFNVGRAYNELRKYSESEGAYLKCIELDPEYIDAYYNLADVYETAGDNVNAAKFYKLYTEKENRTSEKEWVEKAVKKIQELESK